MTYALNRLLADGVAECSYRLAMTPPICLAPLSRPAPRCRHLHQDRPAFCMAIKTHVFEPTIHADVLSGARETAWTRQPGMSALRGVKYWFF